MIENTTFIVPLRIESTDRMRNVIVSTCYLLDNTDAKVIIKEVDKESVFHRDALPILENILDEGTVFTNFNFIFILTPI